MLLIKMLLQKKVWTSKEIQGNRNKGSPCSYRRVKTLEKKDIEDRFSSFCKENGYDEKKERKILETNCFMAKKRKLKR